jgi:hypothetical protein
MVLYRILALLLVLIVPTSVEANNEDYLPADGKTRSVEGIVTNEQGHPIEGVEVILVRSVRNDPNRHGQKATTDKEGEFHFNILGPGTVRVD